MESYEDRNVQNIEAIEFSILGNRELLRISAIQEPEGISIPEAYDNQEPRRGGVVDTRMGVIDKHTPCATCGLGPEKCPGHFGHIELSKPIFHWGYIDWLKKILSCVCIRCSKLLVVTKNEADLTEILKNKTSKARLTEIKNLVKSVNYCQKVNRGCGAPIPKISKLAVKGNATIQITAEFDPKALNMAESSDILDGRKKIRHVLTPETCYDILSHISDEDCRIMGLDPDISHPKMMILKVFPVPPVPVRPTVRADYMGSAAMEDSLTHKLADIIRCNLRIRRASESMPNESSKYNEDSYRLLQYHGATYHDNDTLTMMRAEQKNGQPVKSLTARLKGKEGRIRGNLMGKRVDFSARTVITPDPNLRIDEVGVPVTVAMNITFPEEVTPTNYDYMTKLVRRGRDTYPGANYVFPANSMKTDGRKFKLDLRYQKANIQLRYGDIVERHLVDGDPVLFNRQPSLHKLSMMTHKVRIIDDPRLSTFRLNVAVTTPYNADFDGDEMNLFAPQSVQTQVELLRISAVSRQVITPGASKPIIGCVQDSLLGAFKLSDDATRVPGTHLMNLLMYTTLFDKDELVDMVDKDKEYTGKEVYSMIIPKLVTMSGKGIKVKDGQLVEGKLSKSALGTSELGLIHTIWNQYGMDETKDFIDNTQRLINNWLLHAGFTICFGDAHPTEEVKNQVIEIVEGQKLKINHMITEMENNPEILDPELFEESLSSELQAFLGTVQNLMLNNFDSSNNFFVTITSGSKGKALNLGQIAGAVGQQIVENQRIQKKVNGRSLPHYHQGDDSAVALGFCENPFIRGLSPQEFFFHTMSGRQGLIDTAIKTADTGYISRKLIKSLEDLVVTYDGTVRNAQQQIVQFYYGDNQINPIYLIKHDIKLVSMNDEKLAQTYLLTKNHKGFDKDAHLETMKEYRDMLRQIQKLSKIEYKVVNEEYKLPVNIRRIIETNQGKGKGPDLAPSYILEKLEEFLNPNKTVMTCMTTGERTDSNTVKYKDEMLNKTLLRIALYNFLAPKRCIEEYRLNRLQFDQIMAELVEGFNNAIVNPGEMVGIVAAQSISEPATQMSIDYWEPVQVLDTQTHELYEGPIGQLIDGVIGEEFSGQSDVVDVSHLSIVGVSQQEKTSWMPISQVSRHPSNGGLVKVKTHSGRSVVATLSHSFLKKEGGNIVPVKGSDLRVGDFVPTAKSVPQVGEIDLTEFFDSLDCDFGKDYMSFTGEGLDWRIVMRLAQVGIWCKFPGESLEIPNHFVAQFRERVGSSISGRMAKLESMAKQAMDPLYDQIPGLEETLTQVNQNLEGGDDNLLHAAPTVSKKDLQTYLQALGAEFPQLDVLVQSINSDLVWDEIVELEPVEDQGQAVYDFTVPGNETFMLGTGILVHNTLNTFHTAGVASKGMMGVPRLRELLQCTKKPKTPKMYIFLQPEYMRDRSKANNIASYIRFTTLAHMAQRVEIRYDPDPYNNSFMAEDNADQVFQVLNPTKHSCQAEIAGLPWLIRIVLSREKMLTREVRLIDIKSKFCHFWAQKNLDPKSLKREDRALMEQISQAAILSNYDNSEQPIIHIRLDMANLNYATLIAFQDLVMNKFKLKGIKGIEDTDPLSQEKVMTVDQDTNDLVTVDNWVVYTNGINMREIRYLHGVDINKTVCNNVIDVYKEYGIEAARMAIIKELLTVIESGGNSVNYQHLSVLVDIMTNTGGLTSIDRHGFNQLDTDPLARASFEKTVDHFITAAVFGEKDSMRSVSSRIMAGRVVKGGTGLCDIVLDTELLENAEYVEENEKPVKQTFDQLTTNVMLADVMQKKEVETFMPDF